MKRLSLSLLSFHLACASTPSATPSDLVYVNVIAACSSESMPGATGELVGPNGVIMSRDVAGIDGALRFQRYNVDRATYLIVCHEGYSCGIMKLKANGASNPDYIVLAPQMAVQTFHTNRSDRP